MHQKQTQLIISRECIKPIFEADKRRFFEGTVAVESSAKENEMVWRFVKIQWRYFSLAERLSGTGSAEGFEKREITRSIFSRTSHYFAATSLPGVSCFLRSIHRANNDPPGGYTSPRKWAAFSNWTTIIRIIATRIITAMIRKIAPAPLWNRIYSPASSWSLAALRAVQRRLKLTGEKWIYRMESHKSTCLK